MYRLEIDKVDKHFDVEERGSLVESLRVAATVFFF